MDGKQGEKEQAEKQKPLRRVMLSSCKNTAWEKSKCLRHPQLPGPELPCLELGPGWETPRRTRTLSCDGER